MSSEFGESEHILATMADVKADLGDSAIYLNGGSIIHKSDALDDIISSQEVTVETADYGKGMLPMIVDDVEIAMVNELLQEEKASDELRAGLSSAYDHGAVSSDDATNVQTVRFLASNTPRGGRRGQLRYRVVDESEAEIGSSDGMTGIVEGTQASQVDPRQQMHFIRYFKREGKTFKVWECGICQKQFRHQYTLMRHLPTHTDERNFKCKECGKGFRQMSTLAQHQAIHSDARPYACELCRKTFNRVSTLISHRKTHSDQKPHRCHVCGKGFHQKGNLRNHVFTHTNERPYKCDACGKGFNQMSNLMCHKQKAHGQRSARSRQRQAQHQSHHQQHQQQLSEQNHQQRLRCRFCEMMLGRYADLRAHEEITHGVRQIDHDRFQVVDALSYSQLLASGRVQLLQPQPPLQLQVQSLQQPPATSMENKVLHPGNSQMQPVPSSPSTAAVSATGTSVSSPNKRGAGLALLRTPTGASVVCRLLPHAGHKQVVLAPLTSRDIKTELSPEPSVNQEWMLDVGRQQEANFSDFGLQPVMEDHGINHGYHPIDNGDVGVDELRAAEQHIMLQTIDGNDQ
ncbi:zinc finger protein 358-like [Schistocerca gregaria]|uniref:zinc finger protein 358-like n=1 Tax=Schistocerca gregaria TaxID=7010 RepID=UPI00211EB941|nr:zinc finger protein 358-like [Schistocerca gregaria]